MSHPYMPLYWADYIADTPHLTTLQHGAYLLLIGHYWRSGALPNDDDQLARIARLSCFQWKKIRPVIADFFSSGWKHPRIDSELEKAQEKYQRRANAGKKGGIAKAMLQQKPSNATAMLQQCSSNQNQNQIQIEVSKKESSLRSDSKERRQSFPKDYQPNETTKRVNVECGFTASDLAGSTEDMRLWAVSKGERRADWDATHQGWIRRAAAKRHTNVIPIDWRKEREEQARIETWKGVS